MWPWRRQSKRVEMELPRKYFISHSYRDVAVREALLKRLPAGVEPFIFPPIVIAPEQMVSDKLLDAIRGCDGLIYLQGGESARSFWVALERDYALRLGRPVFAYDPATGALIRDESAPLELNAFMSYAHSDAEGAERIVTALRRRNFDPWVDRERIQPGSMWQRDVETGIEHALAAGGYVVALWSARAEASRWVTAERMAADGMKRSRVLIGLLDRTPAPFIDWQDGVVQLYGDEERLEAHRLDDLIVRLYWLIYQNTRQNALS